jgi:uncharacterized protein YndB with AHSA1/START domain
MIVNKHDIFINRPPEDVFPLIADFNNWRKWHPGPHQIEKTSPGVQEVGTTWRLGGQVRGETVWVEVEITAYEQNKHFHFKTTSGPIQAEDRFSLEAIDDGTRLKLEMILADPEIASQAKDQWDKSLKALKELLEGGD